MITVILVVSIWVALAVVWIGIRVSATSRRVDLLARPDSFATDVERDIAAALANVADVRPTLRHGGDL